MIRVVVGEDNYIAEVRASRQTGRGIAPRACCREGADMYLREVIGEVHERRLDPAADLLGVAAAQLPAA